MIVLRVQSSVSNKNAGGPGAHEGPVSIRRRRVRPPLERGRGLEARRLSRRGDVAGDAFSVQPCIIAERTPEVNGAAALRAGKRRPDRCGKRLIPHRFT